MILHNLEAGREVDDMLRLINCINGCDIKDGRDMWKWIGAAAEDFSVAAVKDLLGKNRVETNHYVPEWCKWIPSKCNVFIWRAEMNRIATLDALKKRNVDVGIPRCFLCEDGEETTEHIFSSCSVATTLWNHISVWCKIPNIFIFSFRDLLEVREHVGVKGAKKEALKGIIRIGCWNLWRARNEAKFNHKAIKVEKIISDLKSAGFLWYNVRSKSTNISWEDWCKFVIM